MKRKSVYVTAALLTCSMLAGCGGSKDVLDPKNPTAIVVWHYYNGMQKTVFDELVQKFNETVGAQKGIIVTAESKGDVIALAEAVVDSAQKNVGSEEMPDVFASYMDTANTLNELGVLADIKPYMTDEELAAYVPEFLNAGILEEGKLHVLPVAKSTELLYLNKTAWDKFAEDTGHTMDELATWEGLAAAAEDYYDWSGGWAMFGRDAAANYVYIGSYQLGQPLYQKVDGKMSVCLDRDTLKRLWDNYSVPYIKGYYGAYGRFRSDDVKTGDLIACVGSTSSVAYMPTEITLEDGTTYPIESVALPLPNFEGTDAVSVQQGAGMAVTKSDKKKETASVEFLKWFTQEEQNIEFCVDSGYFPVKANDDIPKMMSELLISSGDQEESLIYQSCMKGLETIASVEMYAPPVIENGEDYRTVVTQSMTDFLNECKDEYAGLDEEQKEAYIDQCFEQWMQMLEEGLLK